MINIINGTWQDELPKIADNSIDLIFIDPPYLVTNEKWDQDEVVNLELSKQLFRVAKDSCSIYICCGIGEKSQSLIRWFPIFNEYWHFKDLITWKKQRGIGMRKGWLYTREEFMWFVKNNKYFTWNKNNQYLDEKRQEYGFKNLKNKKYSQFKRITNVWTDIRETNISWNHKEINTNHFTPKPEKALERIILSHTQEGDIVLDCFLGSGTTAKVCKDLNRNCIGIEKEFKYYQFALERIK
jgi:DNA modification methylase